MASTKKIWVAPNFHVDVTGLSYKPQAPSCVSRKQQVTWRWQGIVGNQPSLKRQATSLRLDKLQAIGYYRI